MTPEDSKAEDGRVAKKARVFNVMDYGAMNTDKDIGPLQSDDTAAIQAAIDAAVRER